MKSNKEYRFKENPKEEEFCNKFIEMFKHDSQADKSLSAIVFGWKGSTNSPNYYLTEREEDICINIIQWLGSPVGKCFLESCGFIEKSNK